MDRQDGRTDESLNAARPFLAAIAFMIGLHLLEPGAQVLTPPWTWLGAVPAIAGLGLNLWADAVFRRHGLSSGIPANAWAAALFKHVVVDDRAVTGGPVLITEGPFAWSRNPMYLGMALALLGLGLGLGSATPFLVVAVFPAILDRLYVRPEEAVLAETFGGAWQAYAARVRRWI